MRKFFLFRRIVPVLAFLLLSGCSLRPLPEAEPVPDSTVRATEDTRADAVPPPEHSALYISGVSPEDVILYFQEVCLNAEFIHSGDPAKLQRWETPIRYLCIGAYTDADKVTLDTFTLWLNTLEGFPGIEETLDPSLANLRIHFVGAQEHLALMGEHFSGTDGAVTFWYSGDDEIYDAVISCRTDLDQQTRNSVILEELYNGLGPINDTQLRPDSVIYSEFSEPQWLSRTDELILKLLYHPQMQCGMDLAACEEIIRQLYY